MRSSLDHPPLRSCAVAALLFAAAACGSSTSNDQASPATAAPSTDAVDDTQTTEPLAPTGTDAPPETTPAEEAPPASEPASTRTVESVYGSVEVPAEPQRIFALDEYAGAAMLLAGTEPIAVFAPFRARIPTQLLNDAEVETIPIVFGEWNFEQIAEFDPDLIVLTDIGDPSLPDTLADIAPTVALPFVAPWRDIVSAIGDVTGAPDTAIAITDGITARIEAVADATLPDTSIGVLASGPQFGTFSIGTGAPASSIFEEAGYTRPTVEQQAPTLGVALQVSDENLGEHDADYLLQLGGDEAFYTVDVLQALPTFQAIPAITDGRTSVALGEIWTSSDPFSVFWMVEDLAAIQAGSAPGTIDDVTDRWTEFLDLAAG